ncbi:hypothetical protein RI367_001940 [Sorochytrium milnesiophthora]
MGKDAAARKKTAAAAAPPDQNAAHPGSGGMAAGRKASDAAPLTPLDAALHVQELEEYNSVLLSTIEKKNVEIIALKTELEVEGVIADTYSSRTEELRENKIVELAKRARKLSMALEREKTNNNQLQQRLKELELQEQENAAQMNASEDVQERKRQTRQHATEIRSLKDKISQMNRKLEDERLNSQQLRTDLRATQRALAQEVGEDIPISKLLEEGATWKGRAQQISLLKDKIKLLTKRLAAAAASTHGSIHPLNSTTPYVRELTDSQLSIREDASVGDSNGSFTCISQNGSVSCSVSDSLDMGATNSADSVDDKHRAYIKKLEEDRKRGLDEAITERESLRKELGDIKKKYDGQIARSRNLEAELKSMKEKLTMVVEKASNGDKLVALLQKENDMLLKETRPQHHSSRNEHSMVLHIETLTAKVAAQERLIQELEQAFTAAQSLDADGNHGPVPGVQSVELEKLRELRTLQSEEIRGLRQQVAEMDIQLKNERRARSIQAHNAQSMQAQRMHNSVTPTPATTTQHADVSQRSKRDGAQHVIPPTERDAYEAEIARLKSRVSVLKDEVHVLKGTITSINECKEREIQVYCEMVDNLRQGNIPAHLPGAPNLDGASVVAN